MSEYASQVKTKAGSERSFSFVFAAALLIIGCLPVLHGGTWEEIRIWAVVLSAALVIVGLTRPKLLAVPNRLWLRLGLVLGKVVAPLVMMVIYFTTVTPMGVMARILGRDVLHQKIDKSKATYWITRAEPKSSMKNQF